MSVSISSGGGITIENDPTALKIANNLSDVTDIELAKTNLGITAGGGVDIQTFGSPTVSGTFTWTKPAGAKMVEVWMWGAGAGGGSGGRYATTSNRAGGNGGAAGAMSVFRVSADTFNATETVFVATGGTGALSQTVNSTAGISSTKPASTSFGVFQTTSGVGASGGTTTNGTPNTAGGGIFYGFTFGGGGVAGGGGSITAATSAFGTTAHTFGMPSSGGGGGSGANANSTVSAAGANGNSFVPTAGSTGLSYSFAGGAGGTTSGVQATAGIKMLGANAILSGATGGGGGFYISGQAGGNGGNGGFPAGGGGGGGASDNGFNSGAGGNGANGYVVVISYL